ncbi:hypothetical protein [Desulfotalea psychrophila]|nr:hypothetical protein [Desulfotalea psychrophila]
MGKKEKKKCCGKFEKKGKYCKNCPCLVDAQCACTEKKKKNKKKE